MTTKEAGRPLTCVRGLRCEAAAGYRTTMRIAYGADESIPATERIAEWLRGQGHEVVVELVDRPWPSVGAGVARAVVDGGCGAGIVWCYTGTGVSIAANKVVGARAALCADAATATGARRWNDANVLALSQRLTTEEVAKEIIGAFLEGEPDADEVATIATVEPARATGDGDG